MALRACRVRLGERVLAEPRMGPGLVPLVPYQALAAPG